jgi:hypothetical protein
MYRADLLFLLPSDGTSALIGLAQETGMTMTMRDDPNAAKLGHPSESPVELYNDAAAEPRKSPYFGDRLAQGNASQSAFERAEERLWPRGW